MDRQLHIGVTQWANRDALSELISDAFRNLNCRVINFDPTTRIPEKADLILVFGPFGSLVPIANQVLALPKNRRPKFAVWLTEGLPRPDFPEWLRITLSVNRSWFERLSFQKDPNGLWTHRSGWEVLTRNGFRYRYYGDLLWLKKKGVLNSIATGSKWIANFLRDRHFDPIVAYYGLRSGPEWGEDLKLARDVPVLWMGKIATRRREEILTSIREGLARYNVPVMVVDGQENPAIHGRDRTVLLNRTKIVLNLLRQPWDNNSVRFYLASLNKVLVVSEPTFPHLPLENQVHYVETSKDQIVDTIRYYLENESERQRLAENAHRFVKRELNATKGAALILETVFQRQ